MGGEVAGCTTSPMRGREELHTPARISLEGRGRHSGKAADRASKQHHYNVECRRADRQLCVSPGETFESWKSSDVETVQRTTQARISVAAEMIPERP